MVKNQVHVPTLINVENNLLGLSEKERFWYFQVKFYSSVDTKIHIAADGPLWNKLFVGCFLPRVTFCMLWRNMEICINKLLFLDREVATSYSFGENHLYEPSWMG